MRYRSLCACVLVPCLVSGCFLQREGFSEGDGDVAFDASNPGVDAAPGDADTPPRDANVDDAARDAFVPPDAPGEPDATVVPDAMVEPDAMVDPDTGPTCTVVSLTACLDEAVDEDCDGVIDEGCDCANGGAFDGDACPPSAATCTGTIACTGSGGTVCNPDTSTPACNAMDDDCDGIIDNNSGCDDGGSASCTHFAFGGSSYLFCDFNRTFNNARTHCMAFGYDLVVVEDGPENTALEAEGSRIDSGERWYIGYEDQDDNGSYNWVRGSSSYEGPSFPDSNGECAVIDGGDNNWGGSSCGGGGQSFICEVDPG